MAMGLEDLRRIVVPMGKEAREYAAGKSSGLVAGCGCLTTLILVWIGLCQGLAWQAGSSGLLAAILGIAVFVTWLRVAARRTKTREAETKERLPRVFRQHFPTEHPSRAVAVWTLCDTLSQGGPQPLNLAQYYDPRNKYGTACRQWLATITGSNEPPAQELAANLEDPDAAVRTRAAEWLSFAAGHSLTESLRAAFNGEDKKIMYQAAAALVRAAKTGDKEAAELFSALARRPAGNAGIVAREAQWFLETGGKGAPPDFTKPPGAAISASGATGTSVITCPKCGQAGAELKGRPLAERGAGFVVGGIVGGLLGAVVGAPEIGAAIGSSAGGAGGKEHHCPKCGHRWLAG
jgi:hypothetical protein